MLVCRVILSLYRCLFPCTVTMPFHPVACIKYKLTFVPCNVAGLTVPVTITIYFPSWRNLTTVLSVMIEIRRTFDIEVSNNPT